MALLPLPATPEEWHAIRLQHIGGSEVSALFGVAPPYALSMFALHHVKAGTVPAPPVGNERVEWGIAMEPFIARRAAIREGWNLLPAVYAKDDTTQGMGATLDYLIEPGPEDLAQGMTGTGVLEIKNVDFLVFREKWTNDEPPAHILLQHQHQLACAGLDWGVICALVGGNELHVYRYRANPALIAGIRQRVAAFWADVHAGRQPDIDGSEAAADVLRAMYPEVIDDAIDMSASNEWPEAVADFLAAAKAKKSAEEAYAEAKNRVALLLGEHKRGFGGGYSVSVVVTPEKPDRPAREGEVIKGRAKTQRYMAKEMAA
jgi:predicted phage-related endonuclease